MLSRPTQLLAMVTLWGRVVAAEIPGASAATPLEFFETRIRPILANECYECHGASKQKGGLRLDSRDGVLKGGNSGPAVVPGDSAKSLLVLSIQPARVESPMPKDRPALPDLVVADFVEWVKQGAIDPRDAPPNEGVNGGVDWRATREARKAWWSFQPVTNPVVPQRGPGRASEHPVDRFIAATLAEHSLEPSPPAARPALLRRVTFVLTGLPPAPAELSAFLADSTPEAYLRVVDRLLDSPRFGERWAGHWMDLVRYSESHGSQGDPELPMAWRYRDYLIRAFNQDVPYDQLVREHLAGDQLLRPRLNQVDQLNESVLGPAHLRMVEFGYIPVDALEDQVKVVDNQIDVFSKTFLGLTVSCARCHDHKFDPISQRDFYSLYGIFASSRPGQVVIDAPELKHRNRAEMAVLKERIRQGLAGAWLAAVKKFPDELAAYARRRAEQARLGEETRRLSRELATLEARPRAELARVKGGGIPAGLSQPVACWTFEDDLRDTVGPMHGRVEGGAMTKGGRLILNGTNAWMTTAPLAVDLKEKTLEVWLTLANLEQRGGGALTVQTPDSAVFDSIVFGERESGRWMAGSDFFRRSQDVGGSPETAKPGELVHVAIVYGTDNSITLYRDGVAHGKSYQQGSLQTYTGGSARVVLGKRHLGQEVTALAGEIEEARLYSRALTAAEVAASYQAGYSAVSAAAIAGLLSESDRQTWIALRQRRDDLSAAQTGLKDLPPVWKTAFAGAETRDTTPLHCWTKLSALEGAEFQTGWQELVTHWRTELASRSEFNRTNFISGWNLRGAASGTWFMAGAASAGTPVPAGGFDLEVTGDRVLRGIYPAGVFSHGLTRKQNGVYSSPRFKVDSDNISIRALGEHSIARLVVENYAIGGGGLYPAQSLGSDEMTWRRLDTAYRKGANAYIELATSEDFPNPGLRSGGRPYEDGRAYFGAAEVVFHQGTQPPRELMVPVAFLLAGAAPHSAGELAELYEKTLSEVISKWAAGAVSDQEADYLDYFVRNELLPTSLPLLPGLKELIARYRHLESEIPVPRRAPGVHEAVAFNQPLFRRGQLNQPTEPVPRGFLEMFDDRPFPTELSGRLELANLVASAANPLTARVMVNRLWHHLFGRGLVGTVDNFGRLGEKPTHPELLDFLAARFMERGWSIKDTLRFLLTSETFQQSSVAPAAARRLDPENHWLAHTRIHRLEAEAIRDSILAVSGQLNPQMYDPGVNVYYVGKTEGGGAKGPLDGDRRRSVYQRIRRNAHNPLLEAFDAPKPAGTRGKRDVTNVPAQSLTLLNDPFVIEQAARWARALVAQGGRWDDRVKRMFRNGYGREITAGELADSRDFLHQLAQEHSVPESGLELDEGVWRDFAQSLFCVKEFIYVE